jgi:hypothetical protein
VSGAGSRSRPWRGSAGAAISAGAGGWISGGGAGMGSPCWTANLTRFRKAGWPGSWGFSGSLSWTSSPCASCASRTGSSCPAWSGDGSSVVVLSGVAVLSNSTVAGRGSVKDGEEAGAARNGDRLGSVTREVPSVSRVVWLVF